MGRKPFGHFEGETEALNRMQALRAEGPVFDPHCGADWATGGQP